MTDFLQAIANCFGAADTMTGKYNAAKAKGRPMAEVLPNLAKALNTNIFPLLKTEITPFIAQYPASLGTMESEVMRKLSTALATEANSTNALKLMRDVRGAADTYMLYKARQKSLPHAQTNAGACGILIDEEGRQYNVAGGADYPELGKSIVLFSSPRCHEYNHIGQKTGSKELEITSQDGLITATTPLFWMSYLVLVSVDHNSGELQLSATPQVKGRLINGQQNVVFDGKGIEVSGSGPVTAAWIEKDKNRRPSMDVFLGRLRIEWENNPQPDKPDFHSFQKQRRNEWLNQTGEKSAIEHRADIVSGRAVPFANALGQPNVLNVESHQDLTPVLEASIAA